MDSFTSLVDAQTVLLVGAIATALLLVLLLVRLLKVGARLLLGIAAIVLILQYGFGISPAQLWSEISSLPQELLRLIQGVDLTALSSPFAD